VRHGETGGTRSGPAHGGRRGGRRGRGGGATMEGIRRGHGSRRQAPPHETGVVAMTVEESEVSGMACSRSSMAE
jgi:hypothetical protein